MDTNGIQAIGSYTGQHIHINAGTKDVTMLVACIIASDLSPAKAITDRVSVFRDGTYVSSSNTADITQDQIIEMMVGRSVADIFPKVKVPIGETVLDVEDLSHEKYFRHVSFQVRRGEIFGMMGLVGAGRTELMETIFGVRRRSGGVTRLHGEEFVSHCGADSIHKGFAFVTEDRRGNGIFPVRDIMFNITLSIIPDITSVGYPAQPLAAQGDVKDVIRDRLCDDALPGKVPCGLYPILEFPFFTILHEITLLFTC